MTDDGRIDIFQELVSLSNREQMLAFFDFQLETPGRAAISGLCRISSPKNGGEESQYVSLTFVVDTPDAATRELVDEAIGRLEVTTLQALVPGVQGVLPVPAMNPGAENYVQQADILLESRVKPDRAFLVGRLIPAIQSITKMKGADVVWWEAATAHPPPSKRAAAIAEGGRKSSLLNSLKEYFSRNPA